MPPKAKTTKNGIRKRKLSKNNMENPGNPAKQVQQSMIHPELKNDQHSSNSPTKSQEFESMENLENFQGNPSIKTKSCKDDEAQGTPVSSVSVIPIQPEPSFNQNRESYSKNPDNSAKQRSSVSMSANSAITIQPTQNPFQSLDREFIDQQLNVLAALVPESSTSSEKPVDSAPTPSDQPKTLQLPSDSDDDDSIIEILNISTPDGATLESHSPLKIQEVSIPNDITSESESHLAIQAVSFAEDIDLDLMTSKFTTGNLDNSASTSSWSSEGANHSQCQKPKNPPDFEDDENSREAPTSEGIASKAQGIEDSEFDKVMSYESHLTPQKVIKLLNTPIPEGVKINPRCIAKFFEKWRRNLSYSQEQITTELLGLSGPIYERINEVPSTWNQILTDETRLVFVKMYNFMKMSEEETAKILKMDLYGKKKTSNEVVTPSKSVVQEVPTTDDVAASEHETTKTTESHLSIEEALEILDSPISENGTTDAKFVVQEVIYQRTLLGIPIDKFITRITGYRRMSNWLKKLNVHQKKQIMELDFSV